MLIEQFNVQLPATIAFDYPTAAAVAGFIAKKGGAGGIVAGNYVELESFEATSTFDNLSLNKNTYILGTGCLYPQSETISDFWQFAEKSGTSQSEVPIQRWDVDHWYDPTISKLNLSYARFAAFVSSIDQFDSAAFRMGRAEATALDPQARILLQITGDALSGSQPMDASTTATYVGCMFTDYMDYMRVSLQMHHTGPMMTGNGAPYQSGRVAYSYGLQGPCVGIDTACSSSLVAMHAAHRGIIVGEASSAIASGINALLWHETTVGICQLQALSPVGRCKSFEASADGYGRGEGFVSVYLSSSNSFGDALGVILGGAVNQDGRSSSLTSPHGPSQQVLLATSLRYCGLRPGHIGNIAVHGTGTALGDPIEVGAIQAVMNDSRHVPLSLTSVKSCYGHTEGAAGATGLLFALNFAINGVLAPIMCLRNMNPYVASAVEFSPQLNFMPRQLAAAGNSTRVAGTSSFGMSGVNAHMVVEGTVSCTEPVATCTTIWKLQSYWPAPLQTAFISKFVNKHRDEEAIIELNANAPSIAYLRDHIVAGNAILPGTAILSCIGIAAKYLLGEESSAVLCNTAFISPCNFGVESLQLSLVLHTGDALLVSGKSRRHASSRIATSAASFASVKEKGSHLYSILLGSTAGKVKQQFFSVATLSTPNAKASSMFTGSIEPAESDATLHLSAIQNSTILLPASVAAAGSRILKKDGKLSSPTNNRWTTVAFSEELHVVPKSFTDARIISGGATVSSTISGLEARQASLSGATPAVKVVNKPKMLYSMHLESSLPLIVPSDAVPPFAATGQSSSGMSLMMKDQPAGIGSILQLLQSNGASSLLRWSLNTSLQSHAAHGVLKVAASEGIFSAHPQVVVGASAVETTIDGVSHLKLYSSILFTPVLKSEPEEHILASSSSFSERQHGATLVTGAFGGLGSLVSTWSALEAEPKKLLLAGRTVQHDKLAFINSISAASQNSTITVSQVNVACSEDMSALLAEQSIALIYHTSGALVDALIPNQGLRGERTVFAPKVGALECLERNSRCMAVESVALFSSITSLLGTKGQANYAAANSVLDAAASIWEEQGRSRCASIQWGAWSGSGMAASHPSLLKRLQVQGYGAVSPYAGLKAMQLILSALNASVMVANPFDWTVFLKQFKEYRQLLFGEKEQEEAVASKLVGPQSQQQVRIVRKKSLADTILGLVRGIISDENQAITLETPFFEAGLDSIGMVELNNAMVSTFKLEKLPSTVLFDYPSINDLAQFLTPLLAAASNSAGGAEAERYVSTTSGRETLLPVHDVEMKLLSIIKDEFGVELGNTTTPFSESGLDSITSVEFQKSVQETFHLEDFPVTAVFDFPTVELLAIEVSRLLQRQGGALISLQGHYSNSTEISKPLGDKQVVVTGMASSFPAEGSQLTAFMETMLNEKDTTAVVPISKWDIDSIYAVEAGTPNTSYCRFASLLPTTTQVSFDCEIFRVPRSEAVVMDPHARLLLEHVREAHQDSLLRAGTAVSSREASTAAGVFVGCMWSNEYMEMLPYLGVSQATSSAITGNTFPFLAGRVAYSFGWRGPCVPTDTACSSSLVATHVGRLSMMANECHKAAVGGVNALLSFTTTVKICALQALSPVGRCKSFDASADGYGRGEGFAVVMLEPANKKDSQISVLAYLASTSVNTAGKSSGLTAPSGPAQRELVVDTVAAAGIAPSAVNMLAVHGTGTSLGDPIEIGALCQALELKVPGGREALVVASVKSCFGHTEGAAGLTGALLAIGALDAQFGPSILNLRNMNPYVASSLDQANAAMLPRQLTAAPVLQHSAMAGK